LGIGAVMPARKGGDEQGASVEFRMYIENTFLTDGIFLFPAPIVVMSQSVVKRFWWFGGHVASSVKTSEFLGGFRLRVIDSPC
jgi:hypothetical protein